MLHGLARTFRGHITAAVLTGGRQENRTALISPGAGPESNVFSYWSESSILPESDPTIVRADLDHRSTRTDVEVKILLIESSPDGDREIGINAAAIRLSL